MTHRIVREPLKKLVPSGRNPKGHVEPEIIASINRFGYATPILIDERTGKVIDGHGRLEALLTLRAAGEPPPAGISKDWKVPVVRGWASKDDAEADAYLIAANKLTMLGGWENEAQLTEMLSELLEQGPEMVIGTGYTASDVDSLVASLVATDESTPVDIDAVPEVPAKALTRIGDVWELGPHRLLCGDCRSVEVVTQFIGDTKINLAFTSPPYASQREYDKSSEFRPVPPDGYVDWFEGVQESVAAVLADDGSWFINIKPSADGLDTHLYVMDLVVSHVRKWGWHFATEFCWERGGVPKQVVGRFKNQFEPIYQFAKGEWKISARWFEEQFEPVYQFSKGKWKIRPANVRIESENMIVPLGAGAGDTGWADRQGGGSFFKPEQIRKLKNGSRKSEKENQGKNLARGEAVAKGWAYPGNRLPTFSGSHQATGHTAAFPVGLPEWFIRAFTDEGDTVLDPFMGSGSTLLAADRQDRIAYGIEISPKYCDVICRRWEENTGIVPVLQGKGERSFL